MYSYYSGFSFGFAFVALLIFGLLQLLHISAGSLVDWVIGIAAFEWLFLIVTVPWNIHFEAKAALAEAAESTNKHIPVNSSQISYVKILAKRSLWVAIGLHILSAIGLYSLALTGISAVGYFSAGAALLLTALRPAIEAYKYLYQRLTMIRREFLHPREDIVELRNRFRDLESKVEVIEHKLNPNYPDSWVAIQERQWQAMQNEITRLGSSVENYRATNQAEHLHLEREAKNAIAQLTNDGQFLNHVREIIRFFKEA